MAIFGPFGSVFWPLLAHGFLPGKIESQSTKCPGIPPNCAIRCAAIWKFLNLPFLLFFDS